MTDLSKYSDENIIDIVSSDAEAELRKRGYEYGWYKKEPYVGVIYILINPAFPDLVKIGYADNISKRLKSLNNNSGLPDPYHCFAILHVKKRLEDLKLHKLIDTLDPSLRHAKNREFYEMSADKAYGIFSAIAQISGDDAQLIKNPFCDAFVDEKNINKTSNAETKNSETKTARKKMNTTFKMLGIPSGSSLVYVRDSSITCLTVDDENKVKYNGNIYSISALAKELLGFTSARGACYFAYNGETLVDIRKRLGV